MILGKRRMNDSANTAMACCARHAAGDKRCPDASPTTGSDSAAVLGFGSNNDEFCGLGGALLGAGLGLLTAMIVDYSLAWSDAPEVEESMDSPVPVRGSRVSFTGGLAPLRNSGASVVLGGRF
jgi:hypothetical protein